MGRIRSVLIANRGEIACRIIRTARDMGIDTVAVFADDDAEAPYVHLADRAAHLPGSTARDTYLNQEQVLAAAVRSGADAVHPGYGFLSEEHTFARRCEEQGLMFIGPHSRVLEQMALKDAAKEIAVRAGVPVLPGAAVGGDDETAWAGQVAEVGYPMIVKAVAGGGGRGMHVVGSEAELAEAVRTARREAGNLFGSNEVIVERYLPAPRHIEVQMLADSHGGAVYLYERECSIQRRHQKVIEEAPSPSVDEPLRRRMGASAVDLVRSLGYLGVGTAEFLLDDSAADPEFFFLEMNTRLQVEHPVTEEITGLDLVRLQFEMAAGAPLPFGQDDLTIRGHAIEARLYAEDPAEGFVSRPGELLDYGHEECAGVRYEDGVPTGPSTVSPRFDPMISKVVAWGGSREEAVGRLSGALRRMTVHGIPTNRDFLLAVLGSAPFLAGETRTDFVEVNADLTTPTVRGPDEHLAALIAVTSLGNVSRSAVPFARPGFRILPEVWSPAKRYESAGRSGDVVVVRHRFEGPSGALRLRLRVDDDEQVYGIRHVTDSSARVMHDGLETRYAVARYDDGSIWVNDALRQSGWRIRAAAGSTGAKGGTSGEVSSTLPGTVVAVRVDAGQRVEEGDVLLVVEAMKMEHPIVAPRRGTVRPVVGVGEFVQAGVVLAHVEEDDPA
jgi:acetyl/propionyl-CoA carboxylase alpha subunit